MCDLKGPFKLCTCNENIDKTKPWWELKRRRIKDPDPDDFVIGSIIMPYYYLFGDSELLKLQLNSGAIFDFDYKPELNDELTIHIPEQGSLVLYYRGGSWTYDPEPLGTEVIDETSLHRGIIK